MVSENTAEGIYWALTRDAISRGLMTFREARMIARVGTRKQRYWTRHVRDLKMFISARESRCLKQVI